MQAVLVELVNLYGNTVSPHSLNVTHILNIPLIEGISVSRDPAREVGCSGIFSTGHAIVNSNVCCKKKWSRGLR